ncbi:bifunctional zinc-containing alcohol dehydrogenase/quinone oxidoreductase [Klebsiella pneumoniae]|uniref:Bifunctional zinc-containing alcohol dehydrogenase/quinone oxidoreductase n=1 Tax=Klebsiella pneumoniae TaxID=573 RepID=A0A377V0L4_KLEPN|nr:bifunctional zinc-containing alcohol dehydrogenase/quinone oxidoreductase [Klebsiella pneumoniae]
MILGTDLSGVVVARADDVREVAVGDEVYAMARFPEGAAGGSRAYAEYVSVPVSDLARKPLTLSHQQAAAVPMSLLTAWQFMIDPGHEVANPLQPGRIGRCRWRVNASWSTVRQGESVISPCSWQSGRAPR